MAQVDVEKARFNMLEQQVRTWEVLDPRVLDVLEHTPREHFVPGRYRNLAFTDMQLPIGFGEVMMTPSAEGRVLQALDVQLGDKILEVGTGSGYLTACLARMGRSVISVDIHGEFTQAAAGRLEGLGIHNVSLETGDAVDGWDRTAPYDVIAVTGSVPAYRNAFERQLAIGGRLFLIVGREPVMEAMLITRLGKQEWTRESLFDTVIPPLLHSEPPPRFVF